MNDVDGALFFSSSPSKRHALFRGVYLSENKKSTLNQFKFNACFSQYKRKYLTKLFAGLTILLQKSKVRNF